LKDVSNIQRIQPPDLLAPGGHYSHGTVAGGFVFVSGQLPVTPSAGRQFLRRLLAALTGPGRRSPAPRPWR